MKISFLISTLAFTLSYSMVSFASAEARIERSAISIIDQICDEEPECESITVSEFHISNDNVIDYELFLHGQHLCGLRNCPLYILLSKGDEYYVIDTNINWVPGTVRWNEFEKGDLFRSFSFDGSDVIWQFVEDEMNFRVLGD